MVHRLLVAFVALAVMLLALGGTERVLAPDSPLMQGMLAPADATPGSIEDHHLDDLPAQQSPDAPKLETMAAGSFVAPLGRSHSPDWVRRPPSAGLKNPYLEGLLRPPRASA